jgi:hypothetical protein
MTIKNRGGVFGRNPTFNNVTVDGTLTAPNLTVGDDLIVTDAIGVGTSSPLSSVDIRTAEGGSPTNATFDNALRLTSTATAGVGVGPSILFRGETGNAATPYSFAGIHGVKSSAAGSNYSGDLIFSTQNSGGGTVLTEVARMNSVGGLLIGTTDTDLNDTGDAGVYVEAGGRTKIAATGQEVMQINRSEADTSTRNIVLFYRNGANVGKITGDGTSVAYVTSSDYRLKENVTAITGATDRLKQLNPVRFNFIADTTKTVDGFLAHELQAHVPEAVTGIKDGMQDEEYEITPAVLDEDGNEVTPAVMGKHSFPDYQGVDQAKIVPLLVATIKELEARITALEAG